MLEEVQAYIAEKRKKKDKRGGGGNGTPLTPNARDKANSGDTTGE